MATPNRAERGIASYRKKGLAMAYGNLDELTMQEVVDRVQNVQTVGSQEQIQSVMAVIAKCALELGKDLKNASTELKRFNRSTTRLTWVIIALDACLVIATVVGAIATFK